MTEKELTEIFKKEININFETLLNIITTYSCAYAKVDAYDHDKIEQIRALIFTDLQENTLGIIEKTIFSKSYDC